MAIAKANLSNEDKQLMMKMKRGVRLTFPITIAVLSGVAYALYYDKIDFGRCQKIQAQQLNELGPRIKYVLQHSTPGIVWLVFCVFYVISKRASSPAMVPTSGHEHLTQVARNIFLNSLEQFVLLFSSQLVLVTYLTAKQTLNVIPTLNLLFFVGRVLFFLGYPNYRSLGMGLTMFPILSVVGYIGYRYVKLFTI